MLVGEGFALDGVAEQTRLGCNLASVPGFTVAPVVANAYEMYQASPNPANASPVSSAYQAEKLFGSKTKHVGVYDSTLSTQQSSTAKAVQAFTEAGWKFIPNCSVDHRLQRRGELHAVRAEAPELRRPDHLQRRHSGADALRRLRVREPDRLRPDLGDGLRRLHGGLRPVEHRRPGQQRLRPHLLRAARGGQGRPGRLPVPLDRQEVRRAHLAAGRAGHVLVPPVGHRGQGVRIDPDPPVHDQPPLQGHDRGPAAASMRRATRPRTSRRTAGS